MFANKHGHVINFFHPFSLSRPELIAMGLSGKNNKKKKMKFFNSLPSRFYTISSTTAKRNELDTKGGKKAFINKLQDVGIDLVFKDVSF